MSEHRVIQVRLTADTSSLRAAGARFQAAMEQIVRGSLLADARLRELAFIVIQRDQRRVELRAKRERKRRRQQAGQRR